MSEPLIAPLERLGLEIERMALAAGPTPRRAAPRLRVPRPFGLRPAIVIALVLLILLAAAAAIAATTGLLSGAPVRNVHGFVNRFDAARGRVLPGSPRLTSLRVADPAGGPPWGVRTLRTTHQEGCVQIGRVVGGQLGVLGQDGAFGDDGKFHVLPPSALEDAECQPLDAAGQLFIAVSMLDDSASGLDYACRVRPRPGGIMDQLERKREPGIRYCPPADLRDVTVGTLGPHGRSIDVADPRTGALRTQQADGPDRAFLVVGRPDPHHDPQSVWYSLRTPATGMSAVHYDDGTTCRIAASSDRLAFTEPDLAPPCPAIGYAGTLARPSTVRTLVTATAGPVGTPPGGGPPSRPVRVSFRAAVATPDARSYYVVHAQLWRSGLRACGVESIVKPIAHPVALGEHVTATLWVDARCSLRRPNFMVRYYQVGAQHPDPAPYAGGRHIRDGTYVGEGSAWP
jgi:hypothetical protein